MKVLLSEGKKEKSIFSVGFSYGKIKQKLFVGGEKKWVLCNKVVCKIQKFVGFAKKGGWETVVMGQAICSPRDTYDVRAGRKLSFERAVNYFVGSSVAIPAIVSGHKGVIESSISKKEFDEGKRRVKTVLWRAFLKNVKLPVRLKKK
jgi:hypothetical protein